MDIIKATRGAYVALLATEGITAYDRFVPDNVTIDTYVVITSQDAAEQQDKCDNGHIVSVQLDIIHRSIDNSGGVECDDIAEVVIPLIRQDGIAPSLAINDLLLISGSTRKVSDSTLDGISDTYKIYRRLIRFEHIIKSLN